MLQMTNDNKAFYHCFFSKGIDFKKSLMITDHHWWALIYAKLKTNDIQKKLRMFNVYLTKNTQQKIKKKSSKISFSRQTLKSANHYRFSFFQTLLSEVFFLTCSSHASLASSSLRIFVVSYAGELLFLPSTTSEHMLNIRCFWWVSRWKSWPRRLHFLHTEKFWKSRVD